MSKEVYTQLTNYLTDKADKEYDFEWVSEFDMLDKGSCSFHELLAVTLMREYEVSGGGVFGTRHDVYESVTSLSDFIEEK